MARCWFPLFLAKTSAHAQLLSRAEGETRGKKKVRLNCNVNSSLLLAVRASSALTTTCGSVYGHKSMGAKFTLAHARARMRIQYLASLSLLLCFSFFFPLYQCGSSTVQVRILICSRSLFSARGSYRCGYLIAARKTLLSSLFHSFLH